MATGYVAADRRGSPRTTIAMMTACAFISGVSELLIAGILDHLADDVNVPLGTAGTLIFWHAIAYATVPPLFLFLAKANDRKTTLGSALIIFAIASFAVAYAPTLAWLIGARIVQGAAGGIILTVAIVIATAASSPADQGKALSSVLTGLSFALVIGVPLGIQVAELWNWRLAFTSVGVAAAIAAFTIGGLDRFTASVATETNEGVAQNSRPLGLWIVALAASLMWMSSYATVFSYIAPLLKLEFGVTSRTLSIWILVFGSACMIGGWLGGLLTDRISNATTALTGASFNLVVYALFYILPNSPFGAMIFMVFWGMSSWIIVPAIQSILTSSTSERFAAILISINNSIIQLGICIGSIAGSLIVGIDFNFIMLIGCAFLIAALFFTTIISVKYRRHLLQK